LTDSIFLKDNEDFVMFGMQHLVVLLFFVLAGILLINRAKKLPEKQQFKIANFFAFSLAITVVVWTLLKIYIRGFDIKLDLPFHLCNIIALLLPILTITRKKIYYEIVFFWILAGTTHSIITPDLKNGFPNFIFFKYWYVHAGLIIFILYFTIVFKLRPTFKSALKSFVALQGYIVLMFIVNDLTGANYFYTNRKPDVASALDYLGEWPNYIFVVEIIMIPYFLLFYLPFYLSAKKIKSN
jgi:hypothetical integral membrane protein (TIGR02206 family)